MAKHIIRRPGESPSDSLLNPRTAYRWGLRVALAFGVLAVLLLLAWGFRLHDALDARPTLSLMLFMVFLLVAVVAGAVAVVSATQLAVHKAFTHGWAAGAQATARRRSPETDPRRPDLRVMPQEDGPS